MERSGSVVECLPRDRGATGSSLIGITALWSLSKIHLSWLGTGATQEDRPCLTERLLMGHKESNQINILPLSRGYRILNKSMTMVC